MEYSAAALAIFLAMLGYGVKYAHDLSIESRRAEIKHLSDQIQYLYGPMYALCNASETAWNTFCEEYLPNGGAFFNDKAPRTEEELLAWREWTQEIFMPLNRAMVDTILKNTHLIEGRSFPDSFSKLISHVKPYEIVLLKWKRGDFSEHTAFSNYPTEINTYVKKEFAARKRRQDKLLAKDKRFF